MLRVAGKLRRGVVRLQRAGRANEKLLIVAASSCIMSISHTALRPVLPVFAQVRPLCHMMAVAAGVGLQGATAPLLII